MAEQRTEIAKLGEFGLIKHLTEKFPIVNKSTQKGVGDDCAVLNYSGAKKRVLVTNDLLLEGIHFDLQYTPLKHLGYKAVVVNLSDVYAMNGTPRQIVVGLGVDRRFSVEMMDELFAGIKAACDEYSVDMVGGDTSASLTGLHISITCIGEAQEDQIVYRNGAKENDLICVSGNLGAAYMGLQLLEREKRVLDGNTAAQPDFEGHEYILQRQLKPEARRDIIEELREKGVKPHAMMDISDGLSYEIMHICEQSGVGCRIYEDKIPIDYESACMADELNMSIVTAALNGGEDYELLFTCSLEDYDKLVTMDKIYMVGHITKKEAGMNLVGRQGEELPLKAQGWNSLN